MEKAKPAEMRNPNLHKAVICIVLSALLFSMMNTFVSLSGDIPTIQKAFFRNLFALMVAGFAMIKNECSPLPPKGTLGDLLCRSVFGFAGVLCNFYAVSHLNVSDASLLNKMSPFFAVIFSAILLKEKADKTQWVCIITAFVGALFVIKPSFHNAELAASIAGFCGGLGAGIAYTFVRRITQKGVKGFYVVFFFSAFSTLAALPVVVFNYCPMTAMQLVMLIGAGVSAAAAQFFITTAYSYAPAKEVSIYDYSQIIFSALLGYFVMGQIPDGWSFFGYAVIIAAAFAMYKYNNRRQKA